MRALQARMVLQRSRGLLSDEQESVRYCHFIVWSISFYFIIANYFPDAQVQVDLPEPPPHQK